MLNALQPYIDELPWDSSFDEKGNVVQLGRKLLGVFSTAKYQAAGWGTGASAGVGSFLFSGTMHTTRKIWRSFVKNDQTWIKSDRGCNPKVFSLLSDVDLKREISVWAEENSTKQGAERTSPASLQKWLEARLPSYMEEQEQLYGAGGKDGKVLAVAVAAKRKQRTAAAETTGLISVLHACLHVHPSIRHLSVCSCDCRLQSLTAKAGQDRRRCVQAHRSC